MPPTGGIAEGINTLADEVRVLGRQFFCVEACNDAKEGEVTPRCIHTNGSASGRSQGCCQTWPPSWVTGRGPQRAALIVGVQRHTNVPTCHRAI